MKYIVVLPQKVQKELAELDKRYHGRIRSALVAIGVNPLIGKKLDGEYQDQRSYEVWPYRIIYQIQKDKLIILVIKIGHRQGVY